MLKKAERAHIEDMVRAAEFAFHPEVVRLSYSISTDSADDPAILLTLVVQDSILHPVWPTFDRVRHIEEAIRRIVEPEEYGLMFYLTLRSESEAKQEAACSSK